MKKWYKSFSAAEAAAEKENCEIVTGANGWSDIYYLVPADAEPGIVRLISRSQSDCSGQSYMYRVIFKFSNGELEVFEKVSNHRISMFRAGRIPEEKVSDYFNGYYTLREETSEKIRERKENARLSHIICDTAGKVGHDERQSIRRNLAFNKKYGI